MAFSWRRDRKQAGADPLRPPLQHNSERLRASVTRIAVDSATLTLVSVSVPVPTDQEVEDAMRRIITIAIIVAAAAITTAWSVSTSAPGGPNRGPEIRGASGTVPIRSVVSW